MPEVMIWEKLNINFFKKISLRNFKIVIKYMKHVHVGIRFNPDSLWEVNELIYVTGDMHGDFSRFKNGTFSKLKKGDTLIICGDFGFIWDGTKREKSILKKIGKLKYTVAFIDGCHENFDILERYEEADWNGGRVRLISGRLIQLMRGQVFSIEGKKIFTFGGGHSQDFDIRQESMTWWEREQPTPFEIDEAIHNLEKHRNKVDYIITHEPPTAVKKCLDVDTFEYLEVHAFFDEVIKQCRFKKWYFGKCHIDRVISPKFHALFNEAAKLE